MTCQPSSPAATALLRHASLMAMSLRGYHRHYILWKLRLDPIYALLAGDATPWGRVLDAGCGQGIVALLAAARGDVSDYLGIDLDPRKLRVATKLLGELPVRDRHRWQAVHVSLPEEPLPEAPPFDTVMLLDVLHYWPADTQSRMLQTLRGVMRDGATLHLREGIAGDHGRTGLVGWGERFTTAMGINPRVRRLHFPKHEGLQAMLHHAGFEVERIIPAGGANQWWACRVTPALA